MSLEEAPRRSGFWRVVALVWIAFVSAFAIIDHVALSRLDAKLAAPSPTVTEWPSVQKRLAALEQQALVHGEALESLRDAHLPQQLSDLSARVTALQAAAESAVSKEDHLALTDRVSAMEGRLARTRAAVSQTTMPEVRVTAEKDSPPPFVVLGLEWRGGERFVAVSSAEAEGLAAVRLLRIGDRESDWELQALDGDTAVFVRAGRVERIHVP